MTFLSSSWQCIYGSGCQGVLTAPAPERMEGCCSYGAHFTDEADAQRVAAAAETLTPEQWQFRAKGRRKAGVLKRGHEGDDHDPARGGRLHLLEPPGPSRRRRLCPAPRRARARRPAARAQTRRLLAAAAPARGHRRRGRSRDERTRGMERRHWGEGGAQFAWWCTEAPEAFGARDPVYVTATRRDRGHDRPGRLRPAQLLHGDPDGPAGTGDLIARAPDGAPPWPRRKGELAALAGPGPVAVEPAVGPVVLGLGDHERAGARRSLRSPRARRAPPIRKDTRRRARLRGRPRIRGTAPQLPLLRALGCAPLRNADDVPFSRAAPKIHGCRITTAAMRCPDRAAAALVGRRPQGHPSSLELQHIHPGHDSGRSRRAAALPVS